MFVSMYGCMYVGNHVCMHVCIYVGYEPNVCMYVYVCMYVGPVYHGGGGRRGPGAAGVFLHDQRDGQPSLAGWHRRGLSSKMR